jgi:stalled ribosome rescue protein Dom34
MSKQHYHAVIWIDHREARIFHFSATDVDRLVLRPHDPTRHIHHKAGSIGSGHAAEDRHYLHAVAEAVAQAGAILIAGPADTKDELANHIRQQDPELAKKIAAVETIDHPSDAALVAHAKRYFRAFDRTTPQTQRSTS